ncbi:MAG: hypothetical protein ACRD3S_20905 [Terracidiphilus sp.]
MNMMTFRKIWRRVTSTRGRRALEAEIARMQADVAQHEAEIARLRGENRALLNSILGIAGIPPVFTSSAEVPRSHPSPQSGPAAPATGPVSPGNPERVAASIEHSDPGIPSRSVARERSKNLAQVAAPVRKRSWQQINRTLELEAARKKPSEA